MEQRNIKILTDLLKRPGNGQCADCGVKEIEYASYNIGIFLCPRCALIHNQMGSHVSKTKHLKLDHWENSQIDRMKQVGNLVAKGKYEARVPVGFRRPVGCSTGTSPVVPPPDPQILLEHWITSKYIREEFIGSDNTTSAPPSSSPQYHGSSFLPPLRPYLLGTMESFLMKKGREDPRYFPRRFVLDATTLRYFVKEKSSPKAIIRLVDLDVSLCPPKCAKNACLQLSYLKDGTTRHIYVMHEDSELVMQWLHAIRIGKLAALKEKCTSGGSSIFVSESVLVSFLPQDSLMEGYLWKAGPSPSYAHRRRFFTLSPHRKLMYHVDPLDAYPKGEIFLGSSATSIPFTNADNTSSPDAIACRLFDIEIKNPSTLMLTGYKVSLGGFGEDKLDTQRWVFSLHTPYRTFILGAETERERDRWVTLIDQVLRSDLTPRDYVTCSLLVRKRNGSTLANFSGLLSSSSSTSSPVVSNCGSSSGNFHSSVR